MIRSIRGARQTNSRRSGLHTMRKPQAARKPDPETAIDPYSDNAQDARKRLLEFAAEHAASKAAGYAGWLAPHGTLCDRRDNAAALPIPVNSLLGIPEPVRCPTCKGHRIGRCALPKHFICLACKAVHPNPYDR